MSEKLLRKRRITGEVYNAFDKRFINILNIHQGAFFMSEGVELWDCYPSVDRKTGKPCVVFVFVREDTKEAFDKWCNMRNIE